MSPATVSAAQQHARSAPSAGAPVIASSDLLQGGRVVDIRHNGETYRLQATRLGKLILTK